VDRIETERALTALGEQLAARGASADLVIVGGAGLQVLGIIDRATKDVDVLATFEDVLRPSDPLPPLVVEAAARVAALLQLPDDRLSSGPTSLLQWGLPDGSTDRLTSKRYGALTAHLASRLDQICFKLYAFADLGGGRHEMDLRSLQPTPDELTFAAIWVRTQDPSPAFDSMLTKALAYLEQRDA
jgi:hypothetical protein